MARFARVIAAEIAHHVTQRGNARQIIMDNSSDRESVENDKTVSHPSHRP
jgi:hypothetical protein